MIHWLRKRTFGDWAFATVAIVALLLRGPIFIEHFQKEGAVMAPVTIEGKIFPPPKEKSVMVFWATWCGPCSVELKRINAAIEDGSISAKNLFAVNMGEDQSVIDKTLKERHYRFPVVRDSGNQLAQSLGVSVTPTVAFISADGQIKWLSSGLSPTLIYRIGRFQKD